MKSPNKRFIVLVLLSLLLHIFLFLFWLLYKPEKFVDEEEVKTITIQLSHDNQQPEEKLEKQSPEEIIEPEPEPEPEPLLEQITISPMDNADQFSSDNQEDRSVSKIIPGQQSSEVSGELKVKTQTTADVEDKPPTAEITEDKPIMQERKIDSEVVDREDPSTAKETISSLSGKHIALVDKIQNSDEKDPEESLNNAETTMPFPAYQDYFSGVYDQEGEEQEQAIEFIEDVVNTPGNVALLADTEMSEVVVKQPFSELKSKELQLANEFLDRMNRQVLSVWKNPYKGKHVYRGIAKLELDENGFLYDVFIFKASGHAALDASVLKAIKSVGRFDVPENKIIANRYYSNLRFYYSSVESEVELMPFEKEAKSKE